MDNMEKRHPLLAKRRREHWAELKAAGIEDVAPALVEIAARCQVKVDYCDAAILGMESGVVHMRERRLHAMVEQSLTLTAAWKSARAMIGLDQQQLLNATTPSEAFRALAQEDETDQIAELQAARERVAAHQKYMDGEVERRVAAELAKHGIHEPAALIEAPDENLTTRDQVSPDGQPPSLPAPEVPSAANAAEIGGKCAANAAPLELEPDEPRAPETAVEDMGHVRTPVIPKAAPAPAAPRPREIDTWSNGRESIEVGRAINGEFCPSPWSLR